MYATLGTLEFDVVNAWTSWSSEQGVDYSEHPLFGRKPRLQRVGDKLDTLKLSIRLHAKYADPEAALARIRQVMTAGQPLRLVMGNGQQEGGRWLIETLSEEQRKTAIDGTRLCIELTLSLKEYVQPAPLNERRHAATVQARANTAAAPRRKTKLPAQGAIRV